MSVLNRVERVIPHRAKRGQMKRLFLLVTRRVHWSRVNRATGRGQMPGQRVVQCLVRVHDRDLLGI